MMFKDAKTLKNIIFENPDNLQNGLFILTYAPYCAKHANDPLDGPVFKDILTQMHQSHPYTTPFYYITAIDTISLNTNAKTCKGYLKNICIDIDKICEWFRYMSIPGTSDPNYLNTMQTEMTNLLKLFVQNVRKKQIELGANESIIANYAPCVPYSSTVSRDDELKSTEQFNDALLEEIVDLYPNFHSNNIASSTVYTSREEMLSSIACRFTKAIVNDIDMMMNWTNIMDIFSDINNIDSAIINTDVVKYYILLWLSNPYNMYYPDDVVKAFNDYKVFRNHKYTPLTKEEFNEVFESMASYLNNDISELLSVEAWTELEEGSRESADNFLKNAPKDNLYKSVYDLDALLAEFYTMRYVDTNDYSNQYFLSQFDNLTINSYSYMANNIMICEINDSYLMIPYTNIAKDYELEALSIDKEGNIQIMSAADIAAL